MELALFPIAAILLLLSGVSVPAHAAGQQGTAAALIQEIQGIFADGGALSVRTAQAGCGQSGSPARLRHGRLPCSSFVSRQTALKLNMRDLPGFHAVRIAHALERKQYRTRFGFADGAYLALGPPSRDSEFQLHSTVRG